MVAIERAWYCAAVPAASRRLLLACALTLAVAFIARPTSAAKPSDADDAPNAASSDETPTEDAKPKKSRTTTKAKTTKSDSASGSAKAKTPAKTPKAVAGPPLSYNFKEGERYVYEVEIEVDFGDSTRTISGLSTYKVKRADDDELVLEHDGRLTTRNQPRNSGRSRFDPRHRAALSTFPTSFGGSGELTVNRTGTVVMNSEKGNQLPFLLGPLSTLIFEPLSADNEPKWETSNNLAVASKSSPRSSTPASRSRSRMARPGSEPERPAFVSGAVEEAQYARTAAKGNQVKITKHLHLKTQAASAEVPGMEKTSDGEITFDVKEGVPKKAVFKEVLQVAAASAPLTVTYRLLSASEVAKLDKEAADRKDEQAAKEAEAKRPLDDKDVKALLADLKSPAKARAAADKLAKGPANDQREQVAKALAKLLADKDDGMRTSAAKALAVWGSSDNVPALIKVLQSDNGFLKSEAIKALGAIKDERGAEAVAKQLPADRHNAREALEAMGPMAEPYVVPLLADLDEGVRSEACKILAKIGTDKSRSALETLAQRERGFDVGEAKKALKDIASRE